jgi:hypothetical protein
MTRHTITACACHGMMQALPKSQAILQGRPTLESHVHHRALRPWRSVEVPCLSCCCDRIPHGLSKRDCHDVRKGISAVLGCWAEQQGIAPHPPAQAAETKLLLSRCNEGIQCSTVLSGTADDQPLIVSWPRCGFAVLHAADLWQARGISTGRPAGVLQDTHCLLPCFLHSIQAVTNFCL